MFGPIKGAELLRVTHKLQYVPMLDCLAVSVHLEDVDACDPGIIWIVAEEVQKVHVGPDVVADRNDLVHHNARVGAPSSDLSEKLGQRPRGRPPLAGCAGCIHRQSCGYLFPHPCR